MRSPRKSASRRRVAAFLQAMHDWPVPASLKAIGRAGAGVNNIPVPQMTAKGICVFNAPGANANAVKELVIAGMLLAARNICTGLGLHPQPARHRRRTVQTGRIRQETVCRHRTAQPHPGRDRAGRDWRQGRQRRPRAGDAGDRLRPAYHRQQRLAVVLAGRTGAERQRDGRAGRFHHPACSAEQRHPPVDRRPVPEKLPARSDPAQLLARGRGGRGSAV
jgi:hypothetical protein